MKWLIALVGLIGVAAVGVAVYVVLDNRDPVPNDISACVKKADLTIARSSSALGVVRADAAAGGLRVARRWDFGRTDAVLLRPESGTYDLLVLSNPDAPSLRGDVGRRAYDTPGSFPLVAVELPARGRLAACAQRSAS